MKIVGELVDYLIEIAPETYTKYVVKENDKNVLYVVVLKAIYGMLQASLLWYHELSKKLKEIGFMFKPYDSCVCNRVVKGKQHTVRFHVDDILSSHEDAKVNDEFHQWLNKTFGKLKEVTVSRGKVHTFLCMELNFSGPGKLKVKETTHVQDMIDSCPVKIINAAVVDTPAGNNLMQGG